MKKYVLSICLFYCCSLSAQITYTAADFADVGDEFIQSIAAIDSSTLLDFAQTGANHSWDYSNLQINSQEMTNFGDPNNSGYQNAFIFACVLEGNNIFTCNALWAQLSNLAISSPGGFDLPGLSISNVNNFALKSNQTLEYTALGITPDLGGVALPLVFSYDDVDTIYQFPIAYQNQDESSGHLAISLGQPPTSFSYITNTQRSNVVEGYGNLITPFGSFASTLKMRTVVYQQDTVQTDSSITPLPPIENVIYNWFDLDYGIPVLTATGIVTPQGEVITEVRFVDSLRCLPPQAAFFPASGLNVELDSSGVVSIGFFNLSQNGDEYGWDFGDGVFSSDNSPTHIYSAAGEYTVQLIACNTLSCDPEVCDTSTLIITVSDPYAVGASFTISGGQCQNQNFTFEAMADNANSFSWDFGDGTTSTQQNLQHAFNDAGEHTVTLTATNGLRTEVISQTITVFPNYNNFFSIAICFGESISLPNGDVIGAAGQYPYSYTSFYGCDSTETYIVEVLDPPTIYLGADTTITTNQSLTLTPFGGPFVEYEWSDGSTESTLSLDGATLGIGQFTFRLTVVDQNGCMGADEIIVTVEMPSSNKEAEQLANALQIYPNPTAGLVTIFIDQPGLASNAQFTLFDVHGRKLLEQSAQTGKQEFDLSDFPNGLYLLQLTNEGASISRKLVKW